MISMVEIVITQNITFLSGGGSVSASLSYVISGI